MANHDDILQGIVRGYLKKLSYIARKHGLAPWVKDVIKRNKRGECEATRREADMLARLVDDDRIKRKEIPQALGVSYREMLDKDLLSSIRKMEDKGSYSKLDTLKVREMMDIKKEELENG